MFQHLYTAEHHSQDQEVPGRGWPANGVSASAGGKRHAQQKPSRGEFEETPASKSLAALAA
jgi:hypothetical protein